MQVLIFAIFYKDYGNEYYYRIFGHYKYNFSFRIVETDCLIGDLMFLFADLVIIYVPILLIGTTMDMTYDGKNTSLEVYHINQVLLIEIAYFMYFINTNQSVVQQIILQLFLLGFGLLLMFDGEGLLGLT